MNEDVSRLQAARGKHRQAVVKLMRADAVAREHARQFEAGELDAHIGAHLRKLWRDGDDRALALILNWQCDYNAARKNQGSKEGVEA